MYYPDKHEEKDKIISIRATNKPIGYGAQASILFAFDTSRPNKQLACKYYRTKKSNYESPSIKSFIIEMKILQGNKHVRNINISTKFKAINFFFELAKCTFSCC